MNMSMHYGTVPGVDKQISRIVQGTIQVETEDQEKGFAQMDAVWEQGINTFDTAYIYGKDEFLGKWLASRGVREEAVVLAKGAHPGVRKKVTYFDIAHDLHETLARMKTDYVDLYVLHRDDPEVPVGPLVEELTKWTRAGKIRAFGGSNWTTARLEEANQYAKEHDLIPFACSSPNFSLADQLKEPWGGCITISGAANSAERDWYRAQNMPLFTWSSMAGGFLSGRITRENKHEFTDYMNKLAVDCYASEENFQRLDRAKELGANKGLSLPQMAVAYILSYPLNIFALVGSATAEEAKANVEAQNTRLTEQEMAYLDLRADSPA